MPIIRQVKYRTIPSGKSERAYQQMALDMQDAGESALIIDLDNVELGVLRYYAQITHLTIRGGGKKWQLNGLPTTIQDLCLLEVKVDAYDSLQSLNDLRVFDHRLGSVGKTEGLENFTALQALHFLGVDGLKNLEFLPGLRNLEWMKFSGCMDLERFPDLKSLHSLRRVIVERCQGLLELSAFTSAPNLDDLIIMEMENIKPSDFRSMAAAEQPKRVLPGIGKLNSPDFLEATQILKGRATSSYYGGSNEVYEVCHRKGGQEFRVKLS